MPTTKIIPIAVEEIELARDTYDPMTSNPNVTRKELELFYFYFYFFIFILERLG
jgi:hypothetical protein